MESSWACSFWKLWPTPVFRYANLFPICRQQLAQPATRRADIQLQAPVPKAELVERLANEAPASINNESVVSVDTSDGIKFMLADDSWLLIRPSGTEPVLRVYTEAADDEAVANILAAGRAMVKL